MILSRVIEHVKKQHWTAVFLDFIIVVMGVFIGMQVNTWNGERIRAAQADTARARFIENVRGDITLLATRKMYFNEAKAYGESALAVIGGAPLEDDDARWRFVLAVYQAGQIWPFGPSGQVYRELQSAGDLDLIGGPAVRDALASYYDEAAGEIGITFGAVDPYRALVRRRTPWPIQQYIWDNCHPNEEVNSGRDIPEPSFRFMLDCKSPEDVALVRAASDSLRQNREVADYLRGRLAELRVTLNYIENMTDDATHIIVLLQGDETEPAR
jgi:hypothetical protein